MYRYWVGDSRKTGYAPTRAAAEERLNRALVLSADGLLSEDDLTFAEWATIWLSTKINIKELTRKRYQSDIERAISFIGSVKLSKLSPRLLEQMYAALLDSGLSKTSVHSYHVVLGTCLKAALRKGYMSRDVAGITEAPSAQKRNPVILSREQWKSLIAASGNDHELIIEFALKTGMRIDVEALSTTWDQIDIDSRAVTVGASKTSAGEGRVIPLDDDIVGRLLRLRTAHRAKQMATGAKWNPSDFIFCTSKGNRQSYQNLQKRVLEPALSRAGLPRLTWHHLRYNCGSYLLSERVPITMVSKILGHANPATTMSIYAHELHEDAEQVRVAMAKIG